MMALPLLLLGACASPIKTAADAALSRPPCTPPADLMLPIGPLPPIAAGDLMVASQAADSVWMLDLRRVHNALVAWVKDRCQ